MVIWLEEREEEEEKWLKYYSSMHQILLVGEGDFSFSLSLAIAFGSGVNIVATSLDSEDHVVAMYAKGGSNLKTLKMMGATLLHGIDATKMGFHTDLKMRRFDRIVYNFPHAGFKGKEDDPRLICLHMNLVQGFFNNAKRLLRQYGEVHVTHKTDFPYCKWNIKELASRHSLIPIGSPKFNIEDYPGYNNKRGDGSRCDKQFTLGECCTFMFVIGNVHKRKPLAAISDMCSSFSEGSLPDRNVHPLALCCPQNAYLSSLESFPRTLQSFSESIDPYLRYNLGGYVAEPRNQFKGVQETYRNCRSDWLQRLQTGLIQEPEGLAPYIPQAPRPRPLGAGRFYFSREVQEPLKDFHFLATSSVDNACETNSGSRSFTAFEGFPGTLSAENACETNWGSRNFTAFKGFPATLSAENAYETNSGNRSFTAFDGFPATLFAQNACETNSGNRSFTAFERFPATLFAQNACETNSGSSFSALWGDSGKRRV
ncbi:uncharacterized protein LOC120260444 isoform X2 [Dioscorea cayenensis subsp. rotundata]|uniref:Uncharacterized protein LOC120260444 isoform X2 n=1 Tax=Dioscorea cayennensis subsp. rotundata TaxID=55577 RepID=A0AB40BB44_DIOCR|nr:uncharacterized protein LOC120260444 isoform X2 [Dioscorea cayenensis subsp. rotundata]